VTSTIGSLVLFVIVVGLVIAVGIAVGMIVAGRIDRMMAPPRPAGPPVPEPGAEAQPDPARIEEHDE
jgi:hypothetical protein